MEKPYIYNKKNKKCGMQKIMLIIVFSPLHNGIFSSQHEQKCYNLLIPSVERQKQSFPAVVSSPDEDDD